MTGTQIVIEVDDIEVREALDRLLGRLSDPGPAFAKIGEYGVRTTRERIESQNADDPIALWAPLSDAYRRREPKKSHHPDAILILYGDLVSNFAWQSDAASVAWGSNRVYAAAQQFGREEIGLPARPFLGLSARDREEVLAIVELWLSGVVRAP